MARTKGKAETRFEVPMGDSIAIPKMTIIPPRRGIVRNGLNDSFVVERVVGFLRCERSLCLWRRDSFSKPRKSARETSVLGHNFKFKTKGSRQFVLVTQRPATMVFHRHRYPYALHFCLSSRANNQGYHCDVKRSLTRFKVSRERRQPYGRSRIREKKRGDGHKTFSLTYGRQQRTISLRPH